MKKKRIFASQKYNGYKMYNEFYNYLTSSSDFSIKQKDESTISFVYKGLNYLFVYDQGDPYYIRLMLPNLISIKDFDGDIKEIINEYNIKYKAIKFTIVNDALWLSIEQFVYSKDRILDFFSRIIAILETVISNFRSDYLQKK